MARLMLATSTALSFGRACWWTNATPADAVGRHSDLTLLRQEPERPRPLYETRLRREGCQ
jgi:hypothetical protein